MKRLSLALLFLLTVLLAILTLAACGGSEPADTIGLVFYPTGADAYEVRGYTGE